jgi:putative spermidine/putrescine transport system permease protein
MEAADALASAPKRSAGRRLADLFRGRPRLQVGSLLAAPVGWLVIGYLGSLAILLVAAFWQVDALSGEVIRNLTLDNFRTLVDEPVYRTIAFRTLAIASLVTITDALLALPIAFYMANVAGTRTKALLVVGVLMPLWSSYLVKVYAWRTILSNDGALYWALDPLHASGPGYGNVAVWLVMSYLWLPYMIIPMYAGLERIPDSLISASEDLGASPFTTFRRVVLPLVLPAIVAC